MADTEVVIEPGRQDIVVTRVFDAPRDVVFAAYTDPDLVPRWWGSGRFTTEVDRMDVRPGGAWRFVARKADGTGYGFRGVYHDVVAPERIVSTYEFEEGGPGRLQLQVDTLTEVDGKTELVVVSLFQSVEDRDGWIPAAGIEKSVQESMDLLEEIIRERPRPGATDRSGRSA
ncbi:SRPBCC domain-containing protein [Pseudonocardia lacus]|uniref:SRPBCC domain-containing protein n=1 Tax=Pseudonocardia lacus TaxID=2835865 RepID=UPI001BDBFDB2|nr:SRPBCC domain-containing protein [Pseudonocardia lacus]